MEMEYTDLEKGFDLLDAIAPDKKSSDFNVRFALYTAMAQFIIITKDTCALTDLDDLEDSDILEVLRIAVNTGELSGEEDLTLSFHRGKYITQKTRFHAHLCFGEDKKQSYLNIFEEVSVHPVMRTFWPSLNFVKRDWREKPEDDSFDTINNSHRQNVLINPTFNYRLRDCSKILKVYQTYPSLNLRMFEGTQLVYHTQKPQIGLCWSRQFGLHNKQNFVKFIRVLNDLAEAIGVSGSTANDGCHVCVKTNHRGWQFDKSKPLVYGYLHVSGPKFYTICPTELRDMWLQRYKQWDGKVYT